MKMHVTGQQVARVIELAKNYRGYPYDLCVQDIIKDLASGQYQPNPAYAALCTYLEGLGYEAVLDIEALMDYGGELISYTLDPEPLSLCYEYMQVQYGGNKGDISLAIQYIAGKLNLPERLEAALDDVDLAEDGYVCF